jgi:tetratricopeptide (TPR) repeat protein
MPKLTTDVSADLARQIDRIIRDGWFPDEESVFRAALEQFVEAKSFLGDSPRMLYRFAADALNESKPDTALKFVDRALSLLATQEIADLGLYQQAVELRVQTLLILNRENDALTTLEEALERMPNNPAIRKWIDKLKRRGA